MSTKYLKANKENKKKKNQIVSQNSNGILRDHDLKNRYVLLLLWTLAHSSEYVIFVFYLSIYFSSSYKKSQKEEK